MALRTTARAQRGFTLLELMIVVTILAVLASIGVPMYLSAVRNARIVKAKEELRVISRAIDMFRMSHSNIIPATLAEVGHGGRLDPWGRPYMFLNFMTGTGSGMQWAKDKGLVDPAALEPDPLAPVPPLGAPQPFNPSIYTMAVEGAVMLPDLDSSSKTEIDKIQRKDKFLFPLNTDYDLFSLGPNGLTAASLGEQVSLDDVIRANDGGYFGLAKNY